MEDQIALFEAGPLRAGVVRLTHNANSLRSRFMLSPMAAVFVSRLLAKALLAAQMRDFFSAPLPGLPLFLQGDGPLQSLQVHAGADGSYFLNIPVPRAHLGGLAHPWQTMAALGQGKISLLAGLRQKNSAEQVASDWNLVDSDVNFQNFLQRLAGQNRQTLFLRSETDSDIDGQIMASGAVWVWSAQAGVNWSAPAEEPGFLSDSLVRQLEPVEIVREYLPKEYRQSLKESGRFTGLRLVCGCSREKALQTLAGVGDKTLSSLLSLSQPQFEVFCEDCRQTYLFTRRELINLSQSTTIGLAIKEEE